MQSARPVTSSSRATVRIQPSNSERASAPRSRGIRAPNFRPPQRSRESRVRAAPAISCAMCMRKCVHEAAQAASSPHEIPRCGDGPHSQDPDIDSLIQRYIGSRGAATVPGARAKARPHESSRSYRSTNVAITGQCTLSGLVHRESPCSAPRSHPQKCATAHSAPKKVARVSNFEHAKR
jgi:hypothetical protein